MKIGVNKQRNWCQQTAGPVRQTKPSVCVAAPKKPLLHFYPFLLLCFLCLEFALWVKSFKTSGGYHGMVVAVDCPGRENLSSFKKNIQSCSLYVLYVCYTYMLYNHVLYTGQNKNCKKILSVVEGCQIELSKGSYPVLYRGADAVSTSVRTFRIQGKAN